MNAPSYRTLLLGSRFTAPLIMAGCAYATYRWWEGGGQGIIGFLFIGLFIASAKAMSTVAAYRRWRADWEGMSPDAPPKGGKARATTIVTFLAIAVICVVALYSTLPDAPPQLHDWLVLASVASVTLGIAWGLTRLIWRLFPRRQKEQRTSLVAVAVQRPVLPVPSIRDGYERLPDYCHQLLKGRP